MTSLSLLPLFQKQTKMIYVIFLLKTVPPTATHVIQDKTPTLKHCIQKSLPTSFQPIFWIHLLICFWPRLLCYAFVLMLTQSLLPGMFLSRIFLSLKIPFIEPSLALCDDLEGWSWGSRGRFGREGMYV